MAAGSSLQVPAHRAKLWILCLVAGATVSGCSGKDGVPVYPVSGSIAINGTPAAGAIIGLHPVSGDFDRRGTRPGGVVADDGTFKLSTYGVNDGAPKGEFVVCVIWPQFPGRDDPGDDRLRSVFADPRTSKIRVTIEERSNSLTPMALDYVEPPPVVEDTQLPPGEFQ